MNEKPDFIGKLKEKITGVVYGKFTAESFYQVDDPHGFGARYDPPQVPHLGYGPRPTNESSWVYLSMKFSDQTEPERLHPEQIATFLSQRPLEEIYYFLNYTFPSPQSQHPSVEKVVDDGGMVKNMEYGYRPKKDKAGLITLMPLKPYTTSEQRAKKLGAVGPNYGLFSLQERGLIVVFGDGETFALDQEQIRDLVCSRPEDELRALFELPPNLADIKGEPRAVLDNSYYLGKIEYAYRLKKITNGSWRLIPLWGYRAYPATTASRRTSFRVIP